MKRTSHSRHTNSPPKGLLAGLFLSVGTAAGQATAADQTVIALEKFYRSGAICSLAKFDRIEMSGDQYIAHFDVDPRWAEVLVNKDTEYQEKWLALHCPMRVLPVWKTLPKSKDVLISSFTRPGANLSFSCRANDIEKKKSMPPTAEIVSKLRNTTVSRSLPLRSKTNKQ